MLEPFGRNTAPAITLSAMKALENDNDPILLILSSDHEIRNNDKFLKVLNRGLAYAETDEIITFGVLPTNPEIGYGYIKAESPFLEKDIIGKKIIEFTEKPNLNTALKFVQDKSYTWNSGIFMFKAKIILEEIKRYAPKIFEACEKTIKNSRMDLEFMRLDKQAFETCPNISIDLAVMEKTQKGLVLPLDAGWSDIGSWKALWETSKKDLNGNTLKGNIITEESKNCYFRSEKRLVVGIGLKT